MAAANTIECIEELVGEELKGVIPDWEHFDITTKALVFSSGRALVLGDNGSYWVASAKHVERKIASVRADYERGVGAPRGGDRRQVDRRAAAANDRDAA